MTERILCVDDEPAILRSLRRLLRHEGYELLLAESGEQALKVLESNKVTVVVSDMRMPGMDGATLLTKVKELYPETVRIVLTGYADMDATIKAINHGGVFGYMTKPWDAGQIKALVTSAVELAQSNRKNQLAVSSLIRDHHQLKEKYCSQEKDMAMADRYVRDAYLALNKNYGKMEEVLINLLSLKDPTQREILDKVSHTVAQVAEQLCLNEQEKKLLDTTAKLHSVGKIGMADALMMKPFEQLDRHERARFLQYPTLSASTLMTFEPYQEVSQVIMLHKAYLDGSGTPLDTKPSEVTIYARILTASVDYVEYRTGHMTGQAMTHTAALEAMQAHATRYDERILPLISTISMRTVDVETVEDIQIPVMCLRKGMILNRDIHMPSGTLLLKQGTVFTHSVIEQIQRIQRNTDTPMLVSVRFPLQDSAKVVGM